MPSSLLPTHSPPCPQRKSPLEPWWPGLSYICLWGTAKPLFLIWICGPQMVSLIWYAVHLRMYFNVTAPSKKCITEVETEENARKRCGSEEVPKSPSPGRRSPETIVTTQSSSAQDEPTAKKKKRNWILFLLALVGVYSSCWNSEWCRNRLQTHGMSISANICDDTLTEKSHLCSN